MRTKVKKFDVTIEAPSHLSWEMLADTITEAVRLFPPLAHTEVSVTKPPRRPNPPPVPLDANQESWPSEGVEAAAWALWDETEQARLKASLGRLLRASERVLGQARLSVKSAHTPIRDGFDNALSEDLDTLESVLRDLRRQ